MTRSEFTVIFKTIFFLNIFTSHTISLSVMFFSFIVINYIFDKIPKESARVRSKNFVGHTIERLLTIHFKFNKIYRLNRFNF